MLSVFWTAQPATCAPSMPGTFFSLLTQTWFLLSLIWLLTNTSFSFKDYKTHLVKGNFLATIQDLCVIVIQTVFKSSISSTFIHFHFHIFRCSCMHLKCSSLVCFNESLWQDINCLQDSVVLGHVSPQVNITHRVLRVRLHFQTPASSHNLWTALKHN